MRSDMINAKEIGQRIRIERKAQFLSSARIKEETGIAVSTLSDIERGIKTPSIISLLKLAEIMDCSTDWILTGKEHAAQAAGSGKCHASDGKALRPENHMELSESECALMESFRLLDAAGQAEIAEIILLKLRLKKESGKDTVPGK